MSGLTPAGWYPDPTAGGRLRWFDGAAWTDQYAPEPAAPPPAPAAPRPAALVDVRAGRNDAHRLVADPSAVTIDDVAFPLGAIEGVTASAVRSHVNGAYQGTSFTLTLRPATRSARS